jgi:hypothetical protein
MDLAVEMLPVKERLAG